MDVFKAVADPTRRTILALAARGPVRVVDLARDQAMSRPAVSKHVRILADAGLLAAETRGRERHYEAQLSGLVAVAEYLTELGVDVPQHAAAPPVPEVALDALDLAVRRTVRDREGSAPHGTPRAGDPSARHAYDAKEQDTA